MTLNELNSEENYIIYQLSGVNLNTNQVSDRNDVYGPKWMQHVFRELVLAN